MFITYCNLLSAYQQIHTRVTLHKAIKNIFQKNFPVLIMMKTIPNIFLQLRAYGSTDQHNYNHLKFLSIYFYYTGKKPTASFTCISVIFSLNLILYIFYPSFVLVYIFHHYLTKNHWLVDNINIAFRVIC